MKFSKLMLLVFVSMSLLSCSSNSDDSNDDMDDDDNNFVVPVIDLTINGDRGGAVYNDYMPEINFTSATDFSQTFRLDFGTPAGEVLTMVLNQTGGYAAGVVKEIGNRDGNNTETNGSYFDELFQNTYRATSGIITISRFDETPNENGVRIIEGSLNLSLSGPNNNVITVTGTFSNLSYVER